MTIPNDATLRQIEASDPTKSTWLSANAGSGKTRVLTDRVARLLLKGVLPQHILCLTYTKAAASEMQNRLFKRLGAWSMKSDSDLAAELQELGGETIVDAEGLALARTLFARALETPGGLKIQTIHSFCAGLLRRFPLEANVTPQFVEMEERTIERLAEDIVEEMTEGTDANAFDGLARYYTGSEIQKLLAEIIRNRPAFAQPAEHTDICKAIGQDPDLDEESIAAQVFLGGEMELLEQFKSVLATGKPKDQNDKELKKLQDANLTTGFDTLEVLESVFLVNKAPYHAKIGKVPTKPLQKANPNLMPPLEALMARVEAARPLRTKLLSVKKTKALHRFARQFLPEYERRKELHGWLDFDDLITRAGALLSDRDVAQWVLFRLDGGIDHILVDEAQDTSPAQWKVIELLSQEFTAGEGARHEVERTLFVVGDKKQSIYSFQGADPNEFSRMKDMFAERFKGAGKELVELQLEHSFRSSKAILSTVDEVFDQTGGLGLGENPKHLAFYDALPGRVDVWPALEKEGETETPPWYDTSEREPKSDGEVILARRVAEQIKAMVGTATIPIGDNKRKLVTEGDFLILVSSRSTLFHEIIRACKACGLSIAGADRLKVGGELAVKDIVSLMSFIDTPNDDLSLATALRSPLFGWTEREIFDLAHGRKTKHLWPLPKDVREQRPETLEILTDLRNQAEFLRPFDLIERILTRHGGRARLMARLGAEAEDGIDALLAQALAYERDNVPSLTGFLTWVETDELEIKRQHDSAGDRIRVMTVHGAKGLEESIVILPDTKKKGSEIKSEIVKGQNDQPIWKPVKNESSPEMLGTIDEMKQANLEERMRLLYVAMTRAEKWLIVCATNDVGTGQASWYSIIHQGVKEGGAVEHDFGFGKGLRLSHGDWDSGTLEEKADASQDLLALPPVDTEPLSPPLRPAKTLAPSDLGGAKALAGDAGILDQDAALTRGKQLHRLLEHLPTYPQDDWARIAANLLAFGECAANEESVPELLAEAAGILTKPEFAELFGPKSLAEVDVSAAIPELDGQRIHGAIDRLVFEPGRVLVVDFKSNAIVPTAPELTPDGLLRQMGAYGSALAQIYPELRVDLAILWTRTAELMPLPHDIVMKALQDTASS